MKQKICYLILTVCIIFSLCACENDTSKRESSEHVFSVSENTQVYFSKGNLQYCADNNSWKFADHSYDAIGAANENISEDYEGYIDLFGWGATGNNGVLPTWTEVDSTMYGNGHNAIAETDFDFGVALTDELGEGWRMFTHDEIHYLLMFRENADELFGYGTIDDIRGLFILPDDWICPDGIEFASSVSMGFENQYDWYYTIGDKENYHYNTFSKADWAVLENAGAVFLPVTGMRYGNECDHVGLSGHYWTSSYYGEEFANCLCLFEKDLFLEGNFDRCYGLAVRLVRNAN